MGIRITDFPQTPWHSYDENKACNTHNN
jgi:hypothetical protein